jgi:glutaryl-CoA dehydrogenase
MGAARSAFQSALEYSTHRTQFGKPIGGFQLTQAKLAGMAIELTNGTLLALHLGRRKDAMGLRPEQVSMGKLNNVNKALEICRTSRTILGANGISSEYPVMRHMSNLESVLTYEGNARDAHAYDRSCTDGPAGVPLTRPGSAGIPPASSTSRRIGTRPWPTVP